MKIPKVSLNNRYVYAGAVGIVVGAMIMSGIYEFFKVYTLRSPFQNPIIRREISPLPVKVVPIIQPEAKNNPIEPVTLSKADIVASSKYPSFIDHIWMRESGRGTAPIGLNTYCEDREMSNEFGFYPQGKHCFSDFQAGVARLEKWYEDNIDLSDNEKLCKYNTGKVSEDCAYLTLNFQAMN